MTQQKMERTLREIGENPVGQPGYLEFTYEDVYLICVSDVVHDRMRIISPITKVENIPVEELYLLMDSNFHAALDARYATSNGFLYAAFIHPLSSLDDSLLRSAAAQVAALKKSYGTTYSSGALVYGGDNKPATPQSDDEDI